MEFSLGVGYGLRTVADSSIRNVYGNGGVFTLWLSVGVWKGLSLGAAYEGGYSRDGTI
jgi:hypothetical protein